MLFGPGTKDQQFDDGELFESCLAIEELAEAPPGFVQQRNKVKDSAHPICGIFTLQFMLQEEQEALSETKAP